jgi:hypothetical protein
VAGGGIPPAHPIVDLRMTFREGGAYDYHTVFEQIKERLHHALSMAREESRNNGGAGGVGSVDFSSVHLEQLPAYEPATEPNNAEHSDERGPASPTLPNHVAARDSGVAGLRAPQSPKPEHEAFPAPVEPPPGYEEAQIQAVDMSLDQRLRDQAERD